MSTLKKIAVLTMLVVSLIAFNIPASFAANVGTVGAGAGISAAASSTLSATSISSATTTGFGAFGGFGFPFNWGFSPFGVGAFPFNWGIGGGFSPFGLLGWNHFSPGFGCGFPFSPGFLGCCQPLPFILGSELGGSPVLGWDMSPWAFGVQSCTRSLPLYFGAHGFGFPKSIGNWRMQLVPSCGVPPLALPAPCAPLTKGIPAVADGIAKASVDQSIPFIIGSELGNCPVLGWDMSPWAFGVQSCVKSLPVYFGAHGFGFPFSIGNFRIGLTPSVI